MKENEIYPKFEFRISHSDKEWLQSELDSLSTKFNEGEDPSVTKGHLIVAALRHGIRYMHSREKICDSISLANTNLKK